jgi:hypothetical protein
MRNFFRDFENEVAIKKMAHGDGTGPISRILSNVSILIFIFLFVTSVKAKFYWVALLLLLMFTNLGFFLTIGLFIYFIFIQYWVGVILIILYGVVGRISVSFGISNIKKNLYSRRAKVDPFEGMFDLFIYLIFQSVFMTLALLTSGILSAISWSIFGIVTFFEALRYYHRIASPWRSLHYSLMIRYAVLAGHQAGVAKTLSKGFDMNSVLIEFVKNIYPEFSQEKIELLLNSVYKKMGNFTDREGLFDIFKKDYPMLDFKRINEILDKVQENLKKNNPRWIIAEIVENDYGIQERVKYLKAVIMGQVD